MYEIKFSQQEVQIVIAALAELPLKVSMNVFGNIQRQVQEQDAANAIDLSKIDLSEREPG